MRAALHHGVSMRVMAIIALCSSHALSQVSIQRQDVLNIFAPGGQHYYTGGAPGFYDIGKLGGPNVYDFSSISLASLSVSYNYDVSTIPLLASRYPAGCVTFGDSPSTIEKNPVFSFGQDTMYVVGEVTLSPELKFDHTAPWEISMIYPTVYGKVITQTVQWQETTYTSGGAVSNVDISSSEEVTVIDGYGTLRLASGEYQCIRIRKEHRGYGDKEFMYLAREGVFLGVGGVALTDPDTGAVAGGAQILLAASLVDVREPASVPATFSLEQNYPNPFNPTTVISCQLPVASNAKLVVYDLMGREVAVLVDEVKMPGRFEVRFDAKNLASGVYLYRLSAGNYVQTRKLVLLR